MRLIDADALIDFIDIGHLRNPLEACFSERDVVDMLESRPTVDVTPVHGEWIWTERGDDDYEQYWVCDKCGQQQYVETNYCPDCGAKMKE